MLSGRSRLQNMCSTTIRASSGESVSLLPGKYIGILANQSTITKIPVYPDVVDSGKSGIMSMFTPAEGSESGACGMFVPRWACG